jgi:uncharacterized protein YgbK (DUF1537 family)
VAFLRKRVGIVADDITGANDIGLMFAKNGYATAVIPFDDQLDSDIFSGLDVVILDTDSRFDTVTEAADKVRRATALLVRTGFDLYHNKTCSVFRGNIGAELDAMQDVLGVKCSMVVLGFPKNGRTTLHGIHYLNGVPIDHSSLVHDPVHPTTEPELVKIIAQQSERCCSVFDFTLLDQALATQQAALAEMKQKASYVVFDVRDQTDLRKIALLIQDELNICGSSAIGEELPRVWEDGQPASRLEALIHPVEDACGTLILAGSLTEQTSAQVRYLERQGYQTLTLDTALVYDTRECREMVEAIVGQVSAIIRQGRDVLVHTANRKEEVAHTKQRGYEKGLDDAAVGKIVSAAISAIAQGVQRETGCKKMVVAGGDTSAAVSNAFGLHKMLIIKEIEPGVPIMYGYGNIGELLLVFKSGSFGSESFMAKACESLCSLQAGKGGEI